MEGDVMEIWNTVDNWGWTTKIRLDAGAADRIDVVSFSQFNEDQRRQMCFYRDEAIAAARAILKHFGEEVE